jgi:formylglycine-generating enzyme required for sulfatase activity
MVGNVWERTEDCVHTSVTARRRMLGVARTRWRAERRAFANRDKDAVYITSKHASVRVARTFDAL